MEAHLISLFNTLYSGANYLASYAISPSDAFAHSIATYAILSPALFLIFYFVFMMPMIVGDGLVRNIPLLGVIFYRVMAFAIILLASQLVGFALGEYLSGMGLSELVGLSLSPTQIKYGLAGLLALVFCLNSYKKLENLISSTFYWKRSYGLLDGIALGLSCWLVLSLGQ